MGEGTSEAFIEGEVIRVAVDFSEPVTVSGAVRLGFTVGTTERLADYRSGSGTASLALTHAAAAADEDTDGLTRGDLHPRGTIRDDRENLLRRRFGEEAAGLRRERRAEGGRPAVPARVGRPARTSGNRFLRGAPPAFGAPSSVR